MRTSTLLFLAVGSSLFLTFAPAGGEEKEAPGETPRKENRSGREISKREGPPRHERPARPDRDQRTASFEKRTWVGVSTAGIDHALRDHLEIDEGFGIQVIEVLPDSPASVAGLRSNDIIIRFEDQRIISPEHLLLLVRTEKSGEKVAFSIIRKGKEEVVELTLGETDERHSPFRPGSRPGQPYSGRHEYLRRQQGNWQDWMNQNHPEWRGHPSRRENNRENNRESHPENNREGRSQRPLGRKAPTEDAKERPRLREDRPPAVSVNPGFPLHVFGSEGVLKIDNEKGELTLTREDKIHTLELKNAEGEVVYDGPFDPETGVEALPQEARDQLETMKLDNFEIRLPEAPMEAPEKNTIPPVEEPAVAPENGIL